MTEYTVAFNRDTKVVTILQPESEMPKGSEEVGKFNASAVGPNPTDTSIQHILTMLTRKGIDYGDETTVTVNHEPITEVVKRRDEPHIDDNMSAIAEALPPKTAEVAVGEKIELMPNGTGKSSTFTSSDENIVTVDKGGKATGVNSGTAYIDVRDQAGNANQIAITVRTAAEGSAQFAPGAAGADANQAAAQQQANDPNGLGTSQTTGTATSK